MELFFNLGIYGVILIIVAKLKPTCNDDEENDTVTKQCKIGYTYIDYLYSNSFEKTNFIHGILLVITGIIGVLFYDTLGLAMVFIMILVLGSYIMRIVSSMYKFYKLKN